MIRFFEVVIGIVLFPVFLLLGLVIGTFNLYRNYHHAFNEEFIETDEDWN